MTNNVLNPDTTIDTYTGKVVDLANPDPASIDLEDIAWALSTMVRYNGHSERPVTVLEHLLLCEIYAVAELGLGDDIAARLAVLLHDAPEAYIGDYPKPAKQLIPGMPAIDERLMRAILVRLGIPLFVWKENHDVVKRVDNAVLSAEVRVAWPTLFKSGRWTGLDEDLPGRFLSATEIVVGQATPESTRVAYLKAVRSLLAAFNNPQQEV